MTSTPTVSIIFPAKNEGENVRKTLQSLYEVKTHVTFEAIVVDDASSDRCCEFLTDPASPYSAVTCVRTDGVGAANARNVGAEHAKGSYYVFCDAHVSFEDWWLDRLLRPILLKKTDAICPAIASTSNAKSIGYGMSLKPDLSVLWNKEQPSLFETPILPGGCLMMAADVFHAIGGFERGFRRWGHEDVEISIKLWLFGYRCSCEPSVTILHVFRKKQPYAISQTHVDYNLIRMAYSHFNVLRIKRCLKLLKHSDPTQVKQDVINHGALEQRQQYEALRKHNDSWFFSKFSIPF
ncbi:glycosyl transferase family 2 [Pontibacillus halophilus JSM 076056 = DSM 19796]|uniref:Glycosyl transferase family 2 n=2 Tax=Pontibacillus TaxID=289201 RepID=A0A0A5GMI2_9BACI|nr:glycosyltransferase [Pontibacillus halophilus]KGX92433.1 glycosyl transferase family 2 [Pontibacillus halophilus JSM 076056 = DSM 19796]